MRYDNKAEYSIFHINTKNLTGNVIFDEIGQQFTVIIQKVYQKLKLHNSYTLNFRKNLTMITFNTMSLNKHIGYMNEQ